MNTLKGQDAEGLGSSTALGIVHHIITQPFCWWVSSCSSLGSSRCCKELLQCSNEGDPLMLVKENCHPYQGDVAVVPSVVIHQGCPVGHSCYLVAIVPPRHHPGVLVRVLPEPVIGFSEVIQDVPNSFIIDVFDTEPQPCWESTHENMQIKKEGNPCCRLMLRHRGNDRDMKRLLPIHYVHMKKELSAHRTLLVMIFSGCRQPSPEGAGRVGQHESYPASSPGLLQVSILKGFGPQYYKVKKRWKGKGCKTTLENITKNAIFAYSCIWEIQELQLRKESEWRQEQPVLGRGCTSGLGVTACPSSSTCSSSKKRTSKKKTRLHIGQQRRTTPEVNYQISSKNPTDSQDEVTSNIKIHCHVFALQQPCPTSLVIFHFALLQGTSAAFLHLIHKMVSVPSKREKEQTASIGGKAIFGKIKMCGKQQKSLGSETQLRNTWQ
ncbi:hypothetical protein EK904_005194 [Melospiza melodia maxima]|nr:hypothetical protein EK904_005194 [Melospiza melodia maxima]